MKIQVTQGHEKGIGIEVFLKSCLMLSESDISLLELNAFPEAIVHTLNSLRIPFKVYPDGISFCHQFLKSNWIKKKKFSQSFTSLNISLDRIKEGGVLYTLPTSKDQFPGFPGHTEYFRSHYKLPDLGMYFSSPSLKVLLISDHLPLREVVNISEDLIYHRIKTALLSLQDLGHSPARVLVSGFNPHAGEGGLIGQEDERVDRAIKRLRNDFKIEMSGPIPGDTMILEKKTQNDLFVYIFHDQGLGVFKSLQGFIGSNVTLGLPFYRFSPDHGTSFGLFGKNIADYRGCSYSLREAIETMKRVSNGKNSSHKGQGS
jgi:4-hydroxy-L-threonine phosphate dehydrogenase PdxA